MFHYERVARRFVMFFASCAALSLTSCVKEIDTTSVNAETVSSDASINANEHAFVPNELLVKFKEGTSESAKSKLLSRISASVSERILTKTMQHLNNKEAVLLVHTPLAVFDAKKKIAAEEVEYAEPNYIYQHDVISTNDPYLTNGTLWGMSGGYGTRANEAWATNTGSKSVYVGVIDEGAMYSHQDLSGQVWVNSFDPVDGRDNDGNGYVDDTHGWDFDRNDNSTFDGVDDDHGTHVTGTIGAIGNNSKGVVGMNWDITVITVKFLGKRGGTTANAIKAVDYLTDLKTRHGLNICASNNSWGGGGFSQALKDAIDRANAKDILFVAAAGNGGNDGVGDNIDASPSYPASYSSVNIISVASITSSGNRSSFSNYGATSVDIGAPGSSIMSTVPGRNNVSGYASYSGTSMATPHVTGAAALYAASHPGSSAADIKTAILTSATKTASLDGKCVSNGRLNVSGF